MKQQGYLFASLLSRLALAYVFIHAGWNKITEPGGWSAAGYLERANGPFADWFQALAGNPIVDGLVVYGQLFIGLGLLLGILIRFSSLCGALMMTLFYISAWKTHTMFGLVHEQVLIFLLCLLMLFGPVGHIWSMDKWLINRPWVKRYPWLVKWFA